MGGADVGEKQRRNSCSSEHFGGIAAATDFPLRSYGSCPDESSLQHEPVLSKPSNPRAIKPFSESSSSSQDCKMNQCEHLQDAVFDSIDCSSELKIIDYQQQAPQQGRPCNNPPHNGPQEHIEREKGIDSRRSSGLKQKRIVMRCTDFNYDGLCSITGRKHHRLKSRNEDVGSIGDYIVVDRETKKKFHLKIALICDGHGSDVLLGHGRKRIASPGRLISKTAIVAHQYSIAVNLSNLLNAPTLPSCHPDYLVTSRQSIFSKTFNETQQAVKKLVPSVVSTYAGCTSTAIVSIGQKGGNIEILCSNLGDSRAAVFTFRRSPLPYQVRNRSSLPYILISENVFDLTKTHNIKEKTEQKWFIEQCLKRGYRPAAIHRSSLLHKHPLTAVMVPASSTSFDIRIFEPFASLDDVRAAMRYAYKLLPPDEAYSVYTLQGAYLWRIDAKGMQRSTGLQLTGR